MAIINKDLNLTNYDGNGMYNIVEIVLDETTLARVLNRTTISGILSPTDAGSYITSFHYIPVKPLDSSVTDGYSSKTSGTLYIGDTEISTLLAGGSARAAIGGYVKRFRYFTLGQLRYNVESFLDLEPYTQLKLYIPFLGYVDIKPSDVENKYIQIRLLVDFATGDATYFIATSTASIEGTRLDEDLIERIIYTDTCNISCQIPINSTNANEVARNAISSALKTAITVGANMYVGAPDISKPTLKRITTHGGYTKAYSTRNPTTNRFKQKYKMSVSEHTDETEWYGNTERDERMYKARNASTVLNGSIDTINRAYTSARTEGVKGLNNLIISSTDVYLFKIRPKIVEQNSEFEYLYGKPLGQTLPLSSLSGYTEIADIHLSSVDFGTATQEELAILKEELIGGIYLP